MKTLSGIMSSQSKREYLESARARYLSRKHIGKSAMIDEVSDTLGWSRKHTIKALNGQVSLGAKAAKRGSKAIYGEAEKEVIINIWWSSGQPCGVLLKQTMPVWINSYERRNAKLPLSTRTKVLACSARQLDRITKPHKVESHRYGRKTGRDSHRLKTLVPVQCGPQEVDRPGWFEADTVSHGGSSSSGAFMWSLTLTDIYSGWTELRGIWGNSGREVCVGLRDIESHMPIELLGFDCDNGSEFLNTVLEEYLLSPNRKVKWTRSRPYKKNDQAHVEQKNFTHVRQLLGYGRFDEIELVELVNDLYTTAWLPLRNYFTPVMKLVEKTREGSKYKKKYDIAKTPCDRLLSCEYVTEETKQKLRETRDSLDPYELSEQIETKLKTIFGMINEKAEQRNQEEQWLREVAEAEADDLNESTPPTVAIAPSVSVDSFKSKKLAK
jgi:hypothetical protein